ncbi:uncharacterized protein LOC111644036 [Copidosoma floridanum]|uniref:uncharacterized protein LOC111644036 n=1 Tax=Copidosoma floridanum TaxID=29053 RepID=UPI000C6F4E6E|nr:uncharacterized protein LOC111644036 [Copidosoma floridanum]
MDTATRRDWEEELEVSDKGSSGSGNFYPTFKNLADFLRRRCRTLSSLAPKDAPRSTAATSRGDPKSSLLPTAIISVGGSTGCFGRARALLDPCSESTLTTLRLARKYGDGLRNSSIGVVGISGGVMSSSLACTKLSLSDGQMVFQVNAHVLQHFGLITPSRKLNFNADALFHGLKLADPDFSSPRPVDLVLGADVYGRILRSGLVSRGSFIAQRTIFGWTITGAQGDPPALTTSSLAMLQDTGLWSECLVGLMQQYWAVEEIPSIIRVSPADAKCEACYAQHHSRDSSGRYVVPLPVKEDYIDLLGDGLNQARAALRAAQRRMIMDPDLQEHYVAFMSEYIRLGHMRPVSEQEMENCPQRVNYIPHHAIWQRSDGGRRLRVVFNASSPTSTGYSLNDALYPGPKLQDDIVSVLTQWRLYRVAFCADIKMMFRQIQIRKEDVHLQRVIWSQGENEPETHYVLLTVTYGEASAPYLALKTLTQLCEDEGAAFPEAVDAVRRNLYVDDFLTGADDEDTARKRRDQLVQLLKAGGFVLKKWVSNTPSLLHDLKVEDLLRPSWLHFTTDGPVNELGIAWDPSADCFRTNINSKIAPICQVVSEDNDTNFHLFWLNEWQKAGSKVPN